MFKKDLIVSIIIALIIGGILGFVFGLEKASKPAISKPPEDVITLKKSKVIGELSGRAIGEVAEISGRTLLLKADGDTLKIPITEKALVSIFVLGEKEIKEGVRLLESVLVEFEDLRIGDRVSISLKLTDNKEWIGTNITIFPEDLFPNFPEDTFPTD